MVIAKQKNIEKSSSENITGNDGSTDNSNDMDQQLVSSKKRKYLHITSGNVSESIGDRLRKSKRRNK